MPFSGLISTNREINWNNKELTFRSRSVKWASRGGDDQRFTAPGTYHAYSNSVGLKVTPTITVTGSADELSLSVNNETVTFESFTNDTIIKEVLTILPGENEIAVDGTNFDITISVVYRDRFM